MHQVDSRLFEEHQMDGPEGIVIKLYCFNITEYVFYAPNSLVRVEDFVYLLIGVREGPAGPIARLAKRRIGAETGSFSVAISTNEINDDRRSDGRPAFSDSQARTIEKAFGLEIGQYRRLIQEALLQIPI